MFKNNIGINNDQKYHMIIKKLIENICLYCRCRYN